MTILDYYSHSNILIDIVVFDYVYFSSFHAHNGDDALPTYRL
jgi:hypothetical protein